MALSHISLIHYSETMNVFGRIMRGLWRLCFGTRTRATVTGAIVFLWWLSTADPQEAAVIVTLLIGIAIMLFTLKGMASSLRPKRKKKRR